MTEQSFQRHAKWVPAFHFFVLPVLLINIGFQIYWCVKAFTIGGVVSVLVSAALFVGIGTARGMFRTDEKRSATACSAADVMFPSGVF